MALVTSSTFAAPSFDLAIDSSIKAVDLQNWDRHRSDRALQRRLDRCRHSTDRHVGVPTP